MAALYPVTPIGVGPRIIPVVIRDLHTHSNASDGSLAPLELIELACAHSVEMLAISDHDTLDGYDSVRSADHAIQLIPAIEWSTQWNGRGIHVLGLNVDPDNASLRAAIDAQQAVRAERAGIIAERLERRLGIDVPLSDVRRIANGNNPGRPHFAQYLVDAGVVADRPAAFKKFLGAGKPGDVRHGWASLQTVIDWTRAAGGIAVLAHPRKYRMTATKLRALLDDFSAAGGGGIEVVCGQQSPDATAHLARLARDFGLRASCGSDFHHPDLRWSRPGQFAPLPKDLEAVWDTW